VLLPLSGHGAWQRIAKTFALVIDADRSLTEEAAADGFLHAGRYGDLVPLMR
jgi:hypothetical protein